MKTGDNEEDWRELCRLEIMRKTGENEEDRR